MFSYIFRSAILVDGTGSPARRSDVAIAGDYIAAVRERIEGPAEVIIEADGLALAPGFIDIHSHTDGSLFSHPLGESKSYQGVTTEVTGNCGLGYFPVITGREGLLEEYLAMHKFPLPPEGFTWSGFSAYADYCDNIGLGVNLAPLVGHAPLRIAAVGMDDRPLSTTEFDLMSRLLEQSLRQGAWGMSTGLIYPPGCYAGTEEIVALARILARHDTLYASHIRNECDGLMKALDEAITIGRESGAKIEVSHLKAMGKNRNGGGADALDKIRHARAEGIDIGADQYPYDASATTLSAVIPAWALAGGMKELVMRLDDACQSGKIRAEIAGSISAREGAGGIIVGSCHSPAALDVSGQSLAWIADRWQCPPEDAVIRLVIEESGAVEAVFYSMAAEDVETILVDPHVAVSSDGYGLSTDISSGGSAHPRSWGSFPRVLGHFVRERKLLTLETAVYKMTGLPASRLGLADRGLVRPGYAADLALFDPQTIRDNADYAFPRRYATGIIHLLVNGRPVIRDGIHTGNRPGRVLRKGHECTVIS